MGPATHPQQPGKVSPEAKGWPSSSQGQRRSDAGPRCRWAAHPLNWYFLKNWCCKFFASAKTNLCETWIGLLKKGGLALCFPTNTHAHTLFPYVPSPHHFLFHNLDSWVKITNIATNLWKKKQKYNNYYKRKTFWKNLRKCWKGL